MRKAAVFLVIMAILCSTAYAIAPEPATELQSRSIVIKTTPITGEIIDPIFRPTGSAEQKGLIIQNGKTGSRALGSGGDPRMPVGIIDPNFYPGRDGRQKQTRTSIIDPIFRRGAGQSAGEVTGGVTAPKISSLQAQYKKQSNLGTQARAQLSRPRTTRISGNVTTEAVINVPKLAQTSQDSNPYYLGGAAKAMTAGQAYSMGQKPITQKPNPYALGGAGVPTTAGQAKDIDAILEQRRQRALQALGKVY